MIGERGSATVEFALILPAVVLVILAVAEITVVARTQLELAHAAREGARVAATAPDPDAAIRAAQEALSDGLADRVSVSVSRPSVVGRPASVELRATHRVIGLGWAVPIQASASMRVER